ncbi:hypothetical protein [Clostridium sp.]|uniref:hypothetical protein n=1 Tax=Clostridium sp. TaxID=1506 RepID=UPI0028525070|nr:hypothetical protein [Clostridium sp.]
MFGRGNKGTDKEREESTTFDKEDMPKMLYLLEYKYSIRYEIVREYTNNKFNSLLKDLPQIYDNLNDELRELFHLEVYHRTKNDSLSRNTLDLLEIEEGNNNPIGVNKDSIFISFIAPLIDSVFDIPRLTVLLIKQHFEEFDKELLLVKERKKILEEFYISHTNQKDKEWREQLYDIAHLIYNNEKTFWNKTTSLKEAFERLPNKEKHRKQFELHFKSIYDKFRKQ